MSISIFAPFTGTTCGGFQQITGGNKTGEGNVLPVSFNACEMGCITYGVKSWSFSYNINSINYGVIQKNNVIIKPFANKLSDLTKGEMDPFANSFGLQFFTGELFPFDPPESGRPIEIALEFNVFGSYVPQIRNEAYFPDFLLNDTSSSFFASISGVPSDNNKVIGNCRFFNKDIKIYSGIFQSDQGISVDFKILPNEYWGQSDADSA